jgi:hypothetical protein
MGKDEGQHRRFELKKRRREEVKRAKKSYMSCMIDLFCPPSREK